MQLSEFLSKDLILPELKSTTKQEVLKELVKPLEGKFPGLNIKKCLQGTYRERTTRIYRHRGWCCHPPRQIT